MPDRLRWQVMAEGKEAAGLLRRKQDAPAYEKAGPSKGPPRGHCP